MKKMRGFTLVELMVSFALLMLVIAASGGGSYYGNKYFFKAG